MKRIFNATDSPIVIDGEGHSLGGWEWCEIEEITPEIETAVQNKWLTLEEPRTEDRPDEDTISAEENVTQKSSRNTTRNKRG